MKMTMQKIAELAGVSRGAVDKTIHNRPGVKPEIRKKILRVIEETGYTPLKDRKQMVSPMRAKTVTVILPRLTNPYFIVLKQSLETLSATLPNIQLQFYPCNSTDVRGILDILDRTRQSTDAYLFRGVNSTAICQKLNDIGKPVIFFDSDVPGAERLCLIAEDWNKSGRMSASLLAKSIGYRGQVAVITGSADIPSHSRRLQGFLDVMREKYPSIEIVDTLYSQERPALAYEITNHLLTEYPKLAGICNLAGCSGEIGQAILERRQLRNVRLVCFSTAGDVTALIRKEIVTFSINLMPEEQARVMLDTLYQFFTAGKRPVQTLIHPSITISFDENLDNLIRDFGDE